MKRQEIRTENTRKMCEKCANETNRGITADENFSRGIANFTEKHLKNELIRIADETSRGCDRNHESRQSDVVGTVHELYP